MLLSTLHSTSLGEMYLELTVASDERLDLHGGLSQNGRRVELVRIKNGQCISLRTGSVVDPESPRSQGPKRSMSEESDEDVMRSMARRKKAAQATVKDVQQCSECDKVFKRPCDLTYVSYSMTKMNRLTFYLASMRRPIPGLGSVANLAANTIFTDGQLRRSETVM